MGSTWAVEIYGLWDVGDPAGTWNRVYGGESAWGALRAFLSHRRAGFRSIRILYFRRADNGEAKP